MRHHQDDAAVVSRCRLLCQRKDTGPNTSEGVFGTQRARVIGVVREDLGRFLPKGQPRLPLPTGPERPFEQPVIRPDGQAVGRGQGEGRFLSTFVRARVDRDDSGSGKLLGQGLRRARAVARELESWKPRVDDVVRVFYLSVSDPENGGGQGYPTGPMSLPMPTSIAGTRKRATTNMYSRLLVSTTQSSSLMMPFTMGL